MDTLLLPNFKVPGTRTTSLFFAVICFLLQLAVAVLFSPSSSDLQTYYKTGTPQGWVFSSNRLMRLNNWDSFHYYETAERGYHSPDHPITQTDIHDFRATGGFFPGFPMLVRAFHKLFGLSTQLSLILVSQLCTVIFWLYFFNLLRVWGISLQSSLLWAFFILIYPASFFMVAGYSESLFLMSMIGLIYWTERSHQNRPWFAAIGATHGFIMCSTRILGLCISLFPFLKILGEDLSRSNLSLDSLLKRRTSYGISIGATLISSTGCLAFFIFCYLQFGQWDHYMELQKLGWSHRPSYLAILNPLSYIPRYFFETEIMSLNRSCVPLCIGGILALWASEKRENRFKRIQFYIPAFATMYLAISAKANSEMDSLCRYSFSSFILMILVIAQRIHEQESRVRLFFGKRPVAVAILVLSILSIILSCMIAYRFTHGRWVT